MKECTDETLARSNASILETVEQFCFWNEVFEGIKKELGGKRCKK